MIRIGDTVKIINDGKRYTTFSKWFADNIDNLNIRDVVAYDYDDDKNQDYFDNVLCEVVYIDRKNEICLIREMDDRFLTYLVDLDGIASIKKQMTIEDIEKLLGFQIEIIEKEN